MPSWGLMALVTVAVVALAVYLGLISLYPIAPAR
jgi:hypothetical protein